MSADELAQRLAETRKELFNIRFQSATGALEDIVQAAADPARDRAHPDDPVRAAKQG